MKIDIISDLHLDHSSRSPQDYIPHNRSGAEVLIIAGDTLIANNFNSSIYTDEANLYHEFLKLVQEKYSQTYIVIGNHESYYGYFDQTPIILREVLSKYSNIKLLDNECVALNSKVMLLGGTMWTDMDGENLSTLTLAQNTMNDHNLIKKSFGSEEKFTPKDAVLEFNNFIKFLKDTLKKYSDQKMIICTHHMPSRADNDPYRDHKAKGLFSSDLTPLIKSHSDQILYWIHGHTHTPFKYHVGNTEIICNPHGYKKERANGQQYNPVTIEI